ncbi:Hypothetical protein SCF082_LOCUS51999 [Durusdinium trenchii]|uniref:Centrosomal protein of 70 kDa n=1 Tax=Durusdinium trenchii TaxID=1381693 RepID=A0ABP0SIL6_9DINO
MGAQCSCQAVPEADYTDELPVSPLKEFYVSSTAECSSEDVFAVHTPGSTSVPSDECSCGNFSKESGFKETDSQEDLLFRGQSVRSYRSYHLAGLPGDDGLSEASKSSLTRLQALVERADFLAAEAELTSLMESLVDPASADERAIISASPLVMHIKDELRLYREVGQQCCHFNEPDSFVVYANEHLHQSIRGSFDRHNPRVFHYHLRMVFPLQLAHVFSVAFEEELSTEWNSMLLKAPELIENEQGLHTVTSSQLSAMLGLLKLDFLDRTQRFIDVEGGMLVEYIKTVEEGGRNLGVRPVGHPQRKAPRLRECPGSGGTGGQMEGLVPEMDQLELQMEKLQEANALQRPKTELHTEGKVPEPFQAKSEADAEKRRLAERQERLLLKVRCDEEGQRRNCATRVAIRVAWIKERADHRRMDLSDVTLGGIEAAETKEAKAEMNLKEVKGGAVMEEKLQELKGSNLKDASKAIAEPFLFPRAVVRPAPPSLWQSQPLIHVSEERHWSQLEQISESLHQELKSFLQIFSIRLESQEAALSEATREVRRSSDRVMADLQKRFDTFLEQESERAHLRLEKAAARNVKPDEQVQQSLELRLQEMESHLSSQVLSETSRLWQRLEERLSSKPAPTSDAAEQAVRVHGPDTGLRRSLQSLEERFSAAQARQTRSEMTAQQALAQARQLEAILTEFNVEDHASFQTLSRQVRQISKTLADASRSVSSETFAAFQTNFFALEREVHWDLAVRLASLEE